MSTYVVSALTTAGAITSTSSTPSTTKTTGAVIIGGGLGVSGTINANYVTVGSTSAGGESMYISWPSFGLFDIGMVGSAATIQGTSTGITVPGSIAGGSIIASGTTISTSKTTGALLSAGGLGVDGAIFSASISVGSGVGGGQNTYINMPADGTFNIGIAGSGASIVGTSGQAVSIAGVLTCSNTTGASSRGTGSLVVAGGLGVAGAIYGTSLILGTGTGGGQNGYFTFPSSSLLTIGISGSAATLSLRPESTVANSKTTGAISITGGLGVTGDIWGASISVGTGTLGGENVYFSQSSGLFNLGVSGAAPTIIGYGTGDVDIAQDLTVYGNLTVSGTISTDGSILQTTSGSFTPTVANLLPGATSLVYYAPVTVRKCQYVRIGNVVTVCMDFTYTTLGAPDNTSQVISGLPYTCLVGSVTIAAKKSNFTGLAQPYYMWMPNAFDILSTLAPLYVNTGNQLVPQEVILGDFSNAAPQLLPVSGQRHICTVTYMTDDPF